MAGDTKQLAVMPAHQRLEGGVIATRDGLYALSIAARSRCGRSGMKDH
jgi:hypothetical protein